MQIHKFSAFTLLFWAACLSTSAASTITYTVEKNAHSHNDYVRANPFYLAYNCHFASIEADVFLVDGELYVPDSPGAWDFFMKNEVDFLNTDHPQELANYLQK